MTPEIIQQHNLTQEEYQKILQILGREPNLLELGIFSVMWSEHCSYKSSRRFLKNFPTKGPQVIQGPGENAGVIDIGIDVAVVFKMESHNHPSFIEPYQGAATGVGGILRDVFTMGARPIANLNSLRFGDIMHPKTPFLVRGVVEGIAGYGNCMGIPTVGGEVFFDPCYNGNILVNAMTVGLVDKNKIFKGYASGLGNPVIYVGSKTGRDGIHGATMASDSFDDQSEQKKPTVQVGDPFTEKRLLEACLELMQTDAIVGIQDMGAAGLTSSSFEMASRAGTGIHLKLDHIPLREKGMTPYEMMLSESQERMLLVCHRGKENIVQKIFDKWDLDACVVGEVTGDQLFRASFKGIEVASIPIAPLAEKAPVYDRPRKKPDYLNELHTWSLKSLECPTQFNDIFKKMISHPQFASKKWVYRQYDHQVMTNTVILPGSDAALIRIKGTTKGIAISTDVNSRYCYLDPFVGAQIAVAESGRNVVCSGAKPLAITDCLNFGNPERPEIMWQFEEAVKGLSKACEFLNTPVVSGNVSFYNETNEKSIYPTPTVGMVGVIDDINKKVDSFFKKEGDIILLLGESLEELGGSEYLSLIHDKVCGKPPVIDLQKELNLWKALGEMSSLSLLTSAHDLSDGGLAIALAESCFGKNIMGVRCRLYESIRSDALLFGESQSRVIISVGEDHEEEVMSLASKNKVVCHPIGVVGGDRFVILGQREEEWINVSLQDLHSLWYHGFERGIFKCVE